jgi:glutathione synthase/RimK-type ligase-like ATP-grasp enzyme
MILVMGSSADTVHPRLTMHLRESGHPFVVVDEEQPGRYSVAREANNGHSRFRVEGDGCGGGRPVGAIFVRHAVVRKLDPQYVQQMTGLQTDLNGVLSFAACPVMNPPANAFSNYSKAYQVGLLSEAGFDIPRTLVTNVPERARAFWEECQGEVIFKGVSNVTTLAQVLTPQLLPRLQFLPHSPTLFQEFIRGADYRVHVIGDDVFVTRLSAQNVDYRRSLLAKDVDVKVESAELPPRLIERCIAVTRKLGLILSGIDFKEDASGRHVALELNPYPQFTFYEGRSGQPITRAIVAYLIRHQATETNVFV